VDKRFPLALRLTMKQPNILITSASTPSGGMLRNGHSRKVLTHENTLPAALRHLGYQTFGIGRSGSATFRFSAIPPRRISRRSRLEISPPNPTSAR